ncbi:DUF6529 family protein [Kitasatospora xanthocidica]|uniref:DUF6529 family protein n=1 Tax=Kitasatospora xanthocidica TaxID=83382 RepID=UPI0036E96923
MHAVERPSHPRRRASGLLWALLPVAVTAGLYWYGRAHTPDYASSLFGRRFDDANQLKAQLGTALVGLALVQLLLALWMYGRLPGLPAAPRSVRAGHRLIGLGAFLLSLPIAYHCITAYGVQVTDSRIALHSFAGCFLYGAFAAKIIVVHHHRFPGWALPTAGGALTVLIALLWYSAALWHLNGYHVPGL